MSEMKLGASVSREVMKAALEELEGRVTGRIVDEEFERLFGPRWAKLKAAGVINEALVSAYRDKAAEEEGIESLFDEREQARLMLARFDERHAATSVKRRRKDKAAEAATADAGKKGRRDASEHGRLEDEGRAVAQAGGGQLLAPEEGASPDRPTSEEREW